MLFEEEDLLDDVIKNIHKVVDLRTKNIIKSNTALHSVIDELKSEITNLKYRLTDLEKQNQK